MESIVLNHKKIQNAIFIAVAEGLQLQQPAPNIWFTWDASETAFNIRAWKHPKKEDCAKHGEQIADISINRNFTEMNDVRYWRITDFVVANAQALLDDVREKLGQAKPESKSP